VARSAGVVRSDKDDTDEEACSVRSFRSRRDARARPGPGRQLPVADDPESSGRARAAPADYLSRYIAQKLTERWGQPVIVDSRAGAGGTIPTDAVAKSPPDGYNLVMGHIGPW